MTRITQEYVYGTVGETNTGSGDEALYLECLDGQVILSKITVAQVVVAYSLKSWYLVNVPRSTELCQICVCAL